MLLLWDGGSMVLRISSWLFSAVGVAGAAALAFSIVALVTARGEGDPAGAALLADVWQAAALAIVLALAAALALLSLAVRGSR